MRVLVTGTGNSGSWAIRGEQLGQAIGARVVPRAKLDDILACDVVVCVKRCDLDVFALAHRYNKFIIWDTVDFWAQSKTATTSREEALVLLRQAIRMRAPHGIVFATQRMQHDAEFNGFSLALPHHAHPSLSPRPLRTRVATVGYHGAPYLGRWESALRTACSRLGWAFDPHCSDVSKLDIAVAFRDEPHAGYMATAWKSNVKLANIQAAGTPCLIEPTAGYVEESSGGEWWTNDREAVFKKLAELAPLPTRQAMRARLLAHAPNVALPEIARKYRAWIEAIAA